jgi:hypothetical protein
VAADEQVEPVDRACELALKEHLDLLDDLGRLKDERPTVAHGRTRTAQVDR